MWQKVKPDQNGTSKRTGHLRNQVRREFGKVAAHYGEAHGYGRIQMCIAAAAGDCGKNTSHDGKSPPTRNYHPACAFCF